jgi:hypothetical protein
MLFLFIKNMVYYKQYRNNCEFNLNLFIDSFIILIITWLSVTVVLKEEYQFLKKLKEHNESQYNLDIVHDCL